MWKFDMSREVLSFQNGPSLWGQPMYKWIRVNADGLGHNLMFISQNPPTMAERATVRKQMRELVSKGYQDPGDWLEVS